jgi:hypothetical protein
MNDEEKKHKRLIDDLKNLPKVEAPKNFETELLRKINSSEEVKKVSFWEKLLSPARLAPAALAIVSAVIIFFVVDINSEVMEDPLSIAPKLREDLAILKATQEIPVELKKQSVRQKEKVESKSEEMLSEKKDIAPPLSKDKGDDVRFESETEVDEQLVTDKLEVGRSDSDIYRSNDAKSLGGSVAPSTINIPSAEISKDNLNFLQRNLSSEEKVEVQQLKMKVQTEKNAKTERK